MQTKLLAPESEKKSAEAAEISELVESNAANSTELTQVLRKEDFISSAFLVKLTLTLVIMLMAAAFLLRYLKRRFPSFQGDKRELDSSRVVVRSSAKLSARSKVYLVSVGEESFLISESTSSLVMSKVNDMKKSSSGDVLGDQA